MAELGNTLIKGDLKVLGNISYSGSQNQDTVSIIEMPSQLAQWGLQPYDYGTPTDSELQTWLNSKTIDSTKTNLSALLDYSSNGTILHERHQSTADRRSYYNTYCSVELSSTWDYSGYMLQFKSLHDGSTSFYIYLDGNWWNPSGYKWNTWETDDTPTCLLGSTLVNIGDGKYKKAENLRIGDKILSYNEETGRTNMKEITEIDVYDVDSIFRISTQKYDIETSFSHKFYTSEGLKEANELRSGDIVYNEKHEELKIGNVIRLPHPELVTVYAIEVADNHNMFIGRDNILAHNGS